MIHRKRPEDALLQAVRAAGLGDIPRVDMSHTGTGTGAGMGFGAGKMQGPRRRPRARRRPEIRSHRITRS